MTPQSQPNRKARKAATRESLKRAGFDLFAESGFSETSIAAITRRAGVAHGTFYVHFPSKEALLDELLAAFNVGLVERLLPVWVQQPPLSMAARVRRSADIFVDYWEDHRGFVEVYAQKLAHGMALVELRDGISPEVADLLTRQLATLARDQAVDIHSAQLVVQGVLALWGRFGLQVLFNDQVDRQQALDILVEMTLGALERILPAELFG